MEQKTVVKTFRCNAAEAESLKKEAEKMRMSESAYIRDRVFKQARPRLPPEISSLLEKLQFLNIKIGTNINQTMRFCNSKKYITRTDYKKLTEQLQALDEQYERIYDLLEEAVREGNGDYEAAAHEGDNREEQGKPFKT